jgi:hypothetical protein
MNIEEEKCYICLDNLNINCYNDNKYLKCGCLNRYHTECLDEWAEIQNTCPICRKKINEIEEDNDIFHLVEVNTYFYPLDFSLDFYLEVNNEFYPLMYFCFYILVTIWFFLLWCVCFFYFLSAIK